MKSYRVFQEITVRRVVNVEAEDATGADQAAGYIIQHVGGFFSIEGSGWKYFESRAVVEENKEN